MVDDEVGSKAAGSAGTIGLGDRDRKRTGSARCGLARGSASRRHRYAAALWIHRWSGLVAAPFFLVLCLTGSVLIFREEIDRALGDAPHRAVVARSATAGSLGSVAAMALNPGERVVWLYLDRERRDRLMVGVGRAGHATLESAETRFVDRETGQRLAGGDPEATLTGWASRLHTEWFAGLYGQLFGGVIALLVLACLLSGLAIYAPHVRMLAFAAVRRDRGARVLQRDLHNALGAIVLGWILVVSATGALLATTTLLYERYRTGDLRAMSANGGQTSPANPVGVDRVVAALKTAAPDAEARTIIYPGTDFSSPGTFTVFLYGTHRIDERLFDVAVVDAGDGHVAAIHPVPVALATVAIAQPLHFGTFGGLALRLVWLAATWAVMLVTANGAWLWWRRRQLARVVTPA